MIQKQQKIKNENIAEDRAAVCIVCTKVKSEGMNIWSSFICRDCEQEMVQTEVHEEKYPFFIKQMRKLWMLKEKA